MQSQQPRSKSSAGAVDLLKNITRDPNYVQRLQDSSQGGESSVGKSWDGRFTMSKIPQYDAVNDRFCKFNLRKRGAKPAPKRSLLAGGMLPGGPNKPAWGANAEGYTTMTREHGGGPLPPMKGAPGQGDILAPVGALPPVGANPGASQPGAPVVDAAALGVIPQGQTLEGVWTKSKQRIIKLWDELGVAENDRLAFAQHAMVSPSGESVALMNEEIQRLLDRRNAAVAVEKGVEVREGFLYLLQELSERYSTSTMEKERALRELNALIVPFRNSSLDTVDAILRWRDVQKTSAPYLWKGVSYLYKMSSDMYFLTFSKLGQLLDFDLKSNPLLDPRKELENNAVNAQGGKLPPLRRAKDNQRLKDLPRERIERAERALADEVTRQQQLSMSRAATAPTGAAQDGQVTYVEEEVHLANLVREDQEKNQIMVEEEAWLVAHNNQQQEKDAEENASIKIQTQYRGFMARRLVKAKLMQRMAAIRMQTLARQFLAKLHVGRARAQMKAAKKIQALHRGITTRSTIQEVRHRHNCAVKIQCLFRGHMARKIADMLAYIRLNAITIQRVYRGHRVRKSVRHFLKVERDHYATTVQKHWRAYLVRRNPCNNPRKVEKVVKLQAWARGNMDREFAKQLLIARRAATKVQAWWRKASALMLVAKMRRSNIDRGWENRLHIAVVACTKIQSIVRQYNAKKRCAVLREDRANTIAANAAALMEVEKKRQEELELEKHAKAAKIQALARGAAEREQVKMIRELNSCATEIQRVVRGRMGRLRAQHRHQEHIQELTAMSVTPSDMPSLIETTLLRLAADDEEKETTEKTQEADAAAVEQKKVPSTFATPQDEVDQTSDEVGTLADVSAVHPDKTPEKEDSHDVSGIDKDDDDGESQHSAGETMKPSADTSATEEPKNEQSPSNNASRSAASEEAVAAPHQELDGAAAEKEEVQVVEEKKEVVVTEEIVDPKEAAAVKITHFMRLAASKKKVERLRRSRNRSAGFTSRDVRNQETLFSVRILENWFQARLSRMHFVHKSSLKHAHDIHGRKERRQEENHAAGLIQGAAKCFIERRRSTKGVKDLKERKVIVANRNAIDQEVEHAARQITTFLRSGVANKKAREANRARVEARRAQELRLAEEVERLYAARKIQMAARASVARAHVNERRAENKVDATSEVRASAQVLEYAITRIQGAVFNAICHDRVEKKRKDKAAIVAQLDAEARAQEAAFAQEEEAQDEAAGSSSTMNSPSKNLEAPHSAFNTEHKRRGSRDVHVDFNSAAKAEHPHHDLPKDAPIHTAEEAKLQQRIKALESELAAKEKRQQEEVEAEVKKRVEVEVQKAVSPKKATEVASVQSPASAAESAPAADYVDDVQLLVSAPTDAEIAATEELQAPVTPSDAGAASPNEFRSTAVTPQPDEGIVAATPSPIEVQKVEAPPAEDVEVENKVSEGADPVNVVTAPATMTQAGIPVEPKVDDKSTTDSSAQQHEEAEAPLSQEEKKELDEGFNSSPKAMKGLSALQKKAKNKKPTAVPTKVEEASKKEGEKPAEAEYPKLPAVSQSFEYPADAEYDPRSSQALAPVKSVGDSAPAVVATSEQKNDTPAEAVAAPAWATGEAHTTGVAYPLPPASETFAKSAMAAVRIQCMIRKFIARQRFQQRRVEVEAQRVQRKKETELALAAEAEAALKEQEYQNMKARFAKEQKAAEIIQRAYRCYNARFMLSWKKYDREQKREKAKKAEEDKINNRAATRIQCLARQVSARQKTRQLKKQRVREHQAKKDQEAKEHRAAIRIQCAYRSHNARFELDCRKKRKAENEERAKEEARKIEQRILDQIQADEASRLEKENNSKAALTMQLAWRSYNARFRKEELSRQKDESESKKILLGTAAILQAVGRGCVGRTQLSKDYSKFVEARRKEEQHDANCHNLATTVQPVGRAYVDRAHLGVSAKMDALSGDLADSAIERALNRTPTSESQEPRTNSE